MDYGNIISRSINLAFKRPSLWIFGLFAGGSLQFNIDSERFLDFSGGGNPFEDLENYGSPFTFDSSMLIPLILAGLALWIIFIICACIARPAMIDGVNKLTRGGTYRFGESFSRGIDFLGRFILIMVFYFLIAMGSTIILGLIAALAFGASTGLGLLSLLILLPVGLVAWISTYHIFSLAEVTLVARDVSIGEALSEGWTLFRANIGKCVVLTLIYIGIMIVAGIAASIIALITFGPLNLFVASITENLISFLFLGIILGLPISFVLGGITGTFSLSLYTQFYFGLVEPRPAFTDLPPDPAIAG